MKSNEIKLSNSLSCAMEALQMVETTAEEAGLNREQTNLLRLLTEEMISMTTDILKTCQGTLWLECEHGDCALHLNAMAPMGRLGKPSELQGICVYLAGDASSFTTGADFVIDGAFTCF